MPHTHVTRWSLLFAALLALGMLTSCQPDEDDDTPPVPTAPSTYNFENVSYTGQTNRLDMLVELTNEMKRANTPNTALDAQKLLNMYRNTNQPWSSATLNAATQQLKDKVFASYRDTFEVWIQKLVENSQSTVPGESGTAGVLTNPNNPSQRYIVDENGVEWIQLIEKGIMGACFYYQGTGVYLEDDRVGPTANNTDVTPGIGTPKQHYWDEAFGYYGVPIDFPGNTTGIRFHGKYGNDRNPLLATNNIMRHFIEGRFHINNNNQAGIFAARDSVRANWERVLAGTAIKYLNDAKKNFTNDAVRCHVLSEAQAFTLSLLFNPARKITTAQINTLMNDLIGWNYYTITTARIDSAINLLADVYDMEGVAPQL